jgi:predicted amidohydrolase
MREPLSVAVAQPLSVPYDAETNARTHAAAVRGASARVVVFPEMSLTGYELEAPALAAGDPRLALIIEACADTGSIALVGAPVNGEAGQTHIAMLAVEGTGVHVAYRKMYLGGAEPRRFTPGTRPEALEVDGWRLGLAICKDSSVPQHAAATAALGIDAYVAGVLHHSTELELQGERARRVATAYGVWVAVASFAGSTGGGFDRTAGCSTVWSPHGIAIARAGSDPGRLARAVLYEHPAQVAPPLKSI